VYCNFCDAYDTGLSVSIPHAFSLFKKELGAIAIEIKCHVDALVL